MSGGVGFMYLHSISQLVILLGSRPEGKTNKYIKAISGYNMLIKASQWGYTSGRSASWSHSRWHKMKHIQFLLSALELQSKCTRVCVCVNTQNCSQKMFLQLTKINMSWEESVYISAIRFKDVSPQYSHHRMGETFRCLDNWVVKISS